MKLRPGRIFFAAQILAPLLAAAFVAAPAQAAEGAQRAVHHGDPVHGGAIARRWCAACHVVASDQKTAQADAPSFGDVAKRRTDDKELSVFLADPHPKMPDMHLSRREIEDIVAYIRTQAPAAPREN